MSGAVRLKDHWKEQRLFISRLVAAAFILLLLTGVLVYRLVQLQIVDHQRFSELSQGNRLRIEPLAPTRGLVYDRNGKVLAENLPAWELVLIPEQVQDLSATLDSLVALGLVQESDRARLVQLVRSHRRFEHVMLSNLTEQQASRFAVRRHQYPGVDIREGLIRHYPYGEVAAHAMGYVASISPADLELIERRQYAATSHIGKTGVERGFEYDLHGTVGYRQQIVNAQGRVLLDPASRDAASPAQSGANSALETLWPVPGSNLVLSLDIELQQAAEAALGGARGAVVAIDPRNGDVLALVSAPSFDPNRFSTGLSQEDFRSLNTDPDKPLFNRALAGSYPPGSVIKPFLGLAALYYGVVEPNGRSMCPGFFVLPGNSHRYRDWRPQGHGLVDLHEAIVQSCDVFYYQVAVDLGIDNIESFLKSFGFGAPTGLDISGEQRGVVPSREWKRRNFSRSEDQVWFPGETVITGIGQGFTLVTPIQLAHATATLASRGEIHQPRLVIAEEDSVSGERTNLEPINLGRIDIDDAQWQYIHDAMLGVTTEPRGSGFNAMRGTAYHVAGKTGTAQVFSIAQEEEYDAETVDERLRDHGLFVAFAPAENPVIAISVVVENGGGGASAAAPVARAVLDAYFSGKEYVTREH
jgi:penicillin-binding protein 2